MYNHTIAFHNLGCKVNSYELDNIRTESVKLGFKPVPFDSFADIYVLNTCTVTNIADRKSRQLLHRARALNPKALVIALGCYVDRSESPDPALDLAIGNSEKKDFIRILEDYLKEHPLPSHRGADSSLPMGSDSELPDPSEDGPRQQASENPEDKEESDPFSPSHTRAFLKIQDGCNQFCTYCIIPYVRGRISSREPELILKEAESLAERGFKELVLTGIHISSYGKDFPGAIPPSDSVFCYDTLARLIENIAAIPDIRRIRLGSLEPRIITEGFAGSLAAIDKLCPHFHLSLQSGSASVLKRMNRHYSPREYAEVVRLLRKYFENPSITTDIIVGFPGETESEFQETLDFVRETGLSQVHIFRYSRRDGTPAASMEGQLTEKQKAARAARLKEVTESCSRAWLDSFRGKKLSVLFEEPVIMNGTRYMRGHSREYIQILHPTEEDWTNEIREITY